MPAADRYPRALDRETLDALLLDAARHAGARLLQPFNVSDASGIKARTVIRACGSWQRNAQPAASDLFGFQAHLSACNLPPNIIALIPFPGGYAGVVERANGQATFACCIRRDQLERIRTRGGSAGEAVLSHAMEASAPLLRAVATAKREGPWLGAGPLHPGRRALFSDGVFTVGNAAGEAHPVVGEGIAMAMQSSALLAESLLMQATPEKAAHVYARAWKHRFRVRLWASAAFARLAMLPAAPRLAPFFGAAPGVLTAAARLSGKLR
jgi:2-polyprenyl-6-methoxyphenol hydroxylase-like FAD-dependent oxidoreductase